MFDAAAVVDWERRAPPPTGGADDDDDVAARLGVAVDDARALNRLRARAGRGPRGNI